MNKAIKNSIITWTITLILVHGIVVHEHVSARATAPKIAYAFSTSSKSFLYSIISVNPGTEHFNNILVKQVDVQQKQDHLPFLFILSLLASLVLIARFSRKHNTHTPAFINQYSLNANYKRGPPR